MSILKKSNLESAYDLLFNIVCSPNLTNLEQNHTPTWADLIACAAVCSSMAHCVCTKAKARRAVADLGENLI